MKYKFLSVFFAYFKVMKWKWRKRNNSGVYVAVLDGEREINNNIWVFGAIV